MADFLYSLPAAGMALAIFAATYAIAAAVHATVFHYATGERARAFKALSPGMLPPLGIIFGLLVGFIAVQVWNDFDRAKLAVANEASALRSATLFAAHLPETENRELRSLLSRHIEASAGEEWQAMSGQRASLAVPPPLLIAALERTLALKPANDTERLAQRELASSLESALEARRQRIVVSQSSVSAVKWTGLLLQALVTLIAIALVHSDNRLTAAIALTLFSTGVALSIFMIAAYNRPFTGDISVSPDLLKQVIPR